MSSGTAVPTTRGPMGRLSIIPGHQGGEGFAESGRRGELTSLMRINSVLGGDCPGERTSSLYSFYLKCGNVTHLSGVGGGIDDVGAPLVQHGEGLRGEALLPQFLHVPLGPQAVPNMETDAFATNSNMSTDAVPPYPWSGTLAEVHQLGQLNSGFLRRFFSSSNNVSVVGLRRLIHQSYSACFTADLHI
ncbi:hypothetical protein LAZ67_10001033 [Cordylochernes scorpioides]|uniref:Uncharacterized protein n=1 Tax=Cordylochernes scorpioides TaxID=51811 RepID=A0ABY6KVJ1_9ARAC|nr:hypothetical protein LAZ67_10001033 [Cordylochernes scorpioides]